MNSIHEGRGFGRGMSQRVALITGSGKRIGAATASLLLSEGWFVFLHVRNSLDEAQQSYKTFMTSMESPLLQKFFKQTSTAMKKYPR